MSNQKERKIKSFKRLGSKLHDYSVSINRKAFNLKPKKISGATARLLFLGKNVPINRVTMPDSRILQYVSIAEMRDIIFYDSTDKGTYQDDVYDCDDFADVFQSHMKENYHLNTVAEARHIETLDIDTGDHKNWHRANIFIAHELGVRKLWFLEPQTDRVVEVKDYNELINLTGWLNKLSLFDF